MAVLQKIRVKFGLAISIIIALALLSFIIDPTMLESALQSMSSKYDVGQIAGKSISYTAFQEDIDYYTTINEIVSGSSVQNEQAQQQIRNNAWQSLIDKYLFLKNAKAAGITVGKAELTDLLSGDMVSPIVSQNYAFCDENGQFSATVLSEFVKNLDSDQSGQLRTYWNYIQNSVLTQQYYLKYGSLFSASLVDNPLTLRRTIAENNESKEVDFVMVPFGYTPDSTVTVSGSEIKKFYNSHKNFFRQNASRDIEYVVYEVVPSESDIEATNEKIASVYEEFASAANMKSFLLKNSDRQLNEYWYKGGELKALNEEVSAFADAASLGQVSPIFSDEEAFYAVKIIEEAKIADSVYVRHILLQGENAGHLADSLLNVCTSHKTAFSAIAAQYSADQNSAADGEMGNIGWLTQDYMIRGFEDVLTAKVGEPYKLSTQYGTHIIEVTEKTAPIAKKKVAILQKDIVASNETFNNYYSQANKMATLAASGYDAFRDAADSMGVYAHPMNNVLESNENYGSIDGAKEVTRWVFEAKKAGKVSGILTVDNKYFFVAVLKNIHKEGFTPVAEVAPQIRQQLYSQKLGEKKAAEAAAKIEGLGTMEQIAEALSTTVSTQNMSFSSMANQALDPALIGAAFAAKEGEIYGPVAGNIGVYVLQVKSSETSSFYTEEDAKNLVLQKGQYSSQMVLPVMMEEGDVKDNRARFF